MTVALVAENQRLRDRLAVLEDALGLGIVTPVEWRLTRTEMALFGALYRRGGVLSKIAALAAMYGGNPDDEPSDRIVDVFICKLRKKLAPFSITIETRRGLGWQMSTTGREIARARIDRIAA